MSRAWFALPLLLLTTQAHAQAVDWHLDASHSKAAFTARHLGFAKVEGRFKKFDAKIKADAKTGKIAALEATAQAASVDTGVEKRDADLRTDHFFNAEKYPTLRLKLKSIQWNGDKLTAVVELTIRDVTKEVTFTGEQLGVHAVDFGQGKHLRAAYEATAKINRKEFGLKFAAVAEGLAVVGDEIEIELALEMSYTPQP
jgi:polyisoprenoid-binding protein YceI